MIINLDKEGKPLPPKTKIVTPVKCEKCGSAMILRDSKRGPFLGCSSFPKCRATRQVAKLEGENLKIIEQLIPALKEGGEKAAEMAAKLNGGVAPTVNGKAGPIATDIDCDECGKPMVIREGRRGKFLGCSGYRCCRRTCRWRSEVSPCICPSLARLTAAYLPLIIHTKCRRSSNNIASRSRQRAAGTK